MTDNLPPLQREREAFEAWAKSVIEADPQQWPLMGGHDGEDYWAYMGWQARAAIDAAISALKVAQPLTPAQRRELIDAAGDKTDGLNQDDFAEEIVLAVERHHNISAPQKPKD